MLNGRIDRVDKLDDETIEIVDYKTSLMLPSSDDLHSNLQLSLYQHACQQLWPWARKVKLTLHMLRHNLKMHTTRTPEQIKTALEYVQALGDQIHSAKERNHFPARLSTRCNFCGHRADCAAYTEALAATSVPNVANEDMAHVAHEREQVATLGKLAEARNRELDDKLRDYLQHKECLIAGDRRYHLGHTARRKYPLPETIGKAAELSGWGTGDVVNRLATISAGEVDSMLRDCRRTLSPERYALLRAELEAVAEVTYTPCIKTVRLPWAKV